MSGCQPTEITMPVCQHLIPIKLPCVECKRGDSSPSVQQIQKLAESLKQAWERIHDHHRCLVSGNQTDCEMIERLEKLEKEYQSFYGAVYCIKDCLDHRVINLDFKIAWQKDKIDAFDEKIKELDQHIVRLFEEVRDIRELRYINHEQIGCMDARVNELEKMISQDDSRIANNAGDTREVLKRLQDIEHKTNNIIYPAMSEFNTKIWDKVITLEKLVKYEYEERLEEFDKSLEVLKEVYSMITRALDVARTTDKPVPYKCPCCEGSGKKEKHGELVIDGVKVSDLFHCCISCDGKGVLWK